MADRVGFPYCTKWRNYRYPITQLRKGVGFKLVTATGNVFGHASGERGITIFLSDDWYKFSDALGITYKIIMNRTIIQNECKSISRPRVFIDGKAGTDTTEYDVESGVEGWFVVSTVDTAEKLDVNSSLAEVKFNAGTHQLGGTTNDGKRMSLFTIVPGVHFGFISTSTSAYQDDDECSWTIEDSALDEVPKVLDGTYTCWYQLPTTVGDTVVTEVFPSGLTNKSFNLMWNANRHIVKRGTNAPSVGQTIYLEGSVDKVNWVTISKLVDDVDINAVSQMFQVQWDSNALDGDDYPFKRLKIEYEVGGTPMLVKPAQYIQVNLTPN